jgi:hypothetical protein
MGGGDSGSSKELEEIGKLEHEGYGVTVTDSEPDAAAAAAALESESLSSRQPGN